MSVCVPRCAEYEPVQLVSQPAGSCGRLVGPCAAGSRRIALGPGLSLDHILWAHQTACLPSAVLQTTAVDWTRCPITTDCCNRLGGTQPTGQVCSQRARRRRYCSATQSGPPRSPSEPRGPPSGPRIVPRPPLIARSRYYSLYGAQTRVGAGPELGAFPTLRHSRPCCGCSDKGSLSGLIARSRHCGAGYYSIMPLVPPNPGANQGAVTPVTPQCAGKPVGGVGGCRCGRCGYVRRH